MLYTFLGWRKLLSETPNLPKVLHKQHNSHLDSLISFNPSTFHSTSVSHCSAAHCTQHSQSSTVLHINPFPTTPSQSPHGHSSVEAKHRTQHLAFDTSTEWRRSLLFYKMSKVSWMSEGSWGAKLSPFQQFCKIGEWQRNLKTLESGSYISAVGYVRNGSLFFLMFIITDNTVRNSRDLPS